MSSLSRHINSTKLIRTYNATTVLQTLYKHGSCSRSQLTKLTGMSPATITRIISDLLEQGIVLEGRVGQSTGGRRPIDIHIDHTKLYIVSVKLLHDDCIVALLDLRGQILTRKQLTPLSFDPKGLVAEVVSTIHGLIETHLTNREHILGVGVAISGVCHPEDGLVIKSVNLGWQDVPIAQMLAHSLELPIFIENDANACALAELWFGHARDSSNSIYIKTETGAGAGIVLNKTLLTGPRFLTGEIGHVPLIQGGELCRCGQRGCLEPYVYLGDVLARYQRATNLKINRDEFLELLSQRDIHALQIVEETAPALAVACAHWGILLDLDVITIGGLWGELQEIIEYCQMHYNVILKQSGITCNATITGSGFGDDADLLGAAGLVINHWLTPGSVPLDR